jgi:hypothetical protein
VNIEGGERRRIERNGRECGMREGGGRGRKERKAKPRGEK